MRNATKSQIKHIRDLLKEKEVRDKEGEFVAEGYKIINDIFSKGHSIGSVVVSQAFAERNEQSPLFSELTKKKVPVYLAKNAEFERISSLKSPEGILAVLKKRRTALKVHFDRMNSFIVLCDGVQDPGNMGSIIRASVAFGVNALLLTGENADIFNPKVVRASSGMIMDIGISELAYDEMDQFKRNGYVVFASVTDRERGMAIDTIKRLPSRMIVAFGSEGKGISSEIRRRSDIFFSIPLMGNVESLNVVSAAAISLYMFGKERRDGC